jgi:uncharacterized protein (DUF2236 family)
MRTETSPDAGFFGPSSLTWRLSKETVLLLGGRRALLMQLAHPLVAQGVADHSDFDSDRFGRLFRTIEASMQLIFGPRDRARRVIDRINRVHHSVTGTLGEPVGIYPASTPYSATDPDLLLWVHATLVDTSILFYERFVAPLDSGQRETYYRETIWPAEALGVPHSMVPGTHARFTGYMDDMMSSGRISVGETARGLATAILYPRPQWAVRRLFDPLNVITIGTLPEAVREGYGLRWNLGRRALLRGAEASLRRMLPVTPPMIRYVPQAREAFRRVRS